jgi:DNA gyrase subunit A
VHILDGLLNVTKYIDEVIKLIRNSANPEDASKLLIEKKYVETEVQAKAVLQITLRQLTKLEAQTLQDEQDALNVRILWLIDVLSSSKKIQKLIIKEQDELVKKLGDARRTKIGHTSEDLSHEDLILEEQIVISFSKDGYIKRIPLDTYKVQARGGKGVSAATQRTDDEMSDIYIASTHETLLFFTNKGFLYKKKGYELPIGTRISKGTHIANILSLNANESVTNMIPVKSMDLDLNLILITKNGIIKRSKLNAYDTALKTRGLPAIKLGVQDNLVFAELTDGNKDIFIVTKKGKAIRYPESSVRLTGRMTAGVKALNLALNDTIVQMLIFDVEANPDVLVITEFGFGKRTEITKYRCLQGRFAKGVDTIDKVKIDRNGYIVGACTVMANDSILLLTSQAKIIQIPVESIRSVHRTAAGVKVVNLTAGDTVKSVTKITNGASELENE